MVIFLILFLVGPPKEVSRRFLLPLIVANEGGHWYIGYIKAIFILVGFTLVMWTGPTLIMSSK